jgi:hypothetical protein
MNGTKLSIRQIAILTALDRDTVTRRLQGLQSDAGAKGAGASIVSTLLVAGKLCSELGRLYHHRWLDL